VRVAIKFFCIIGLWASTVMALHPSCRDEAVAVITSMDRGQQEHSVHFLHSLPHSSFTLAHHQLISIADSICFRVSLVSILFLTRTPPPIPI